VLVNIVRLTFLLLAVLVGQVYYRNIFAEWEMPSWFGAAMGLGIASTLLAMEVAFRRKFTRVLVTFMVGLAGGLVMSYLVLAVVDVVIQSRDIKHNLDIPLSLITIYLVLMTVLHNADRFRLVIPFVEFRSRRVDAGVTVIDASALGDPRLTSLVSTGLLGHRLVTHATVVRDCQRMTESDDLREQVRGKRAMEVLNELRLGHDLDFEIDASDIPRAESSTDHVMELARLNEGRLLSADSDLVLRAKAEEVRIVDLSDIAKVLTPKIQIGDTLRLRVVKQGEDPGQGVAYLDDGSMVVIEKAGDRVDEEVACTVMRLHHTSNGRMLFAEIDEGTQVMRARSRA